MAEKTKSVGVNASDLMKAFKTTDESIEARIGIKDKLQMPVPNGKPATVRLLWSKDDNQQPVFVVKKINPKFTNGEAFFMNAELYDTPGEKQISLSASLTGSMMAAAKEAGIQFEDLVNKVGNITAQYFTAAPRSKRRGQCSECHGRGCKTCTVTGSGVDAGVTTGLQTPTVYNFRLRPDLMTKDGASGSDAASKF